MFDEEFYDNEKSQPIARCVECGELIYDDSREMYMDYERNYFCSLECALNFYGIHQPEDCFALED